MLIRRSRAIWRGNGTQGKGTLETQSGALREQPYSAHMRFGSEDGRAGTNPEELIAAAHAGCFAMALAFALSAAGHEPEELSASATVQLDKEAAGWALKGITLELDAKVSGVAPERFQAIAEDAKKSCPVSKALAAVPITLNARLAG